MKELLDAVTSASWSSILLVLLVFGFAPGFVLRTVVLLYPRDDPRRTELVAELKAMRRLERPLWVAEQIETALFEGLRGRYKNRFVRDCGENETNVPDTVTTDYEKRIAILAATRLVSPLRGDYAADYVVQRSDGTPVLLVQTKFRRGPGAPPVETWRWGPTEAG